MPYSGIDPKNKKLIAQIDACVEKVMAQGHDKSSAIGICRASIEKGSTPEEIAEMFSLKVGVLDILKGLRLDAPEHMSASERIAVEEFMAQDFQRPFKILPIGKFYRGDRVLDITPERAREVYANWKAGLPRYGLSINVEHGNDKSQPGAIGRVKEIGLHPDGIYAERTEFSKAGEQLLDEDRYRAVSPEIIWSLNDGAKYQDPKTGEWHDNVLVGLAVTTSPFFGQDVQVFSAKGIESMAEWDTAYQNNLPDSSFAYIEDGGTKDAEGKTTPRSLRHLPYKDKDGKVDLPHLRDAMSRLNQTDIGKHKATALKKLMAAEKEHGVGKGAEENASTDKTFGTKTTEDENFDSPTRHQVHVETPEGGNMAKKTKKELMDSGLSEEEAMKKLQEEEDKEAGKSQGTEEKAAARGNPETFALKAQIDALTAKLDDEKVKREALVMQFAAERQVRRASEFVATAGEQFSALPAKQDELGTNMLWMYDADTTEKHEHYSYFEGLLKQMNELSKTSEAFSAIGSGRVDAEESDPFLAQVEKTRLELFRDKPKADGFAAAYIKVGDEHPELARRYVETHGHRD